MPLFSLRPHVPHPCCLPQMALTPPFKPQLPEASCRGTESPMSPQNPHSVPQSIQPSQRDPMSMMPGDYTKQNNQPFHLILQIAFKKGEKRKKKKNPNMLFLALAELLADSLCLSSFPQREGRKSEGRPQFHFMKRLGFLT